MALTRKSDDVVDGRYRIVRQLEYDGVGALFLVDDLTLQRQAALRMIAPDAVPDGIRGQIGQRLKRIARVKHPHVISVIHIGETGEGQAYLVTALCDGLSLRDAINRRALDTRRALRIVEQIASAVHAVHSEGIVLGDLTPGDVVVDADGCATLVDPGFFSPWALADGSATPPLIGNPRYFAPEQIEGRPIDPRTDVWRLGHMLFESVTLRHVFPDPMPQLVMAILRNPAPAVSAALPGAPARLDAIAARALEKNPDARYPTAAAFAADVRGAIACLEAAR